MTGYLRRLASWLALFNTVWAGAGISVAALWIMLSLGAKEPTVRLTGLVLQLLGIGTIIWGIHETRQLFRLPPFLSKVKGLFAQFPVPGRATIYSATINATLPGITGTGRGYQGSAPPPNATSDQRLDSLEENVALVHQRIDSTYKEMDQIANSANAAVTEERSRRLEEDAKIRSTLEGLGTGGIHISAMGAGWLFLGVLLSTASVEIARLIEKLR